MEPGLCWFARESTADERAECQSRLQRVTGGRWAWWADKDRLFNDSEIAAEHADLRPLVVVLPNGATFCVLQPESASTSCREWHHRQDAWVAEDPENRTWDQAYATLEIELPKF